MSISFREQLRIGQIGESEIASWLRSRGFTILPVYEKELDTGKGPRLFLPQRQLIAPDMLCYRAGDTLWIEAKHKTVFSFYGKTRDWVTGIDLRHYEDYLAIDEVSPWPVWLLFLHKSYVTDPRDVQRWNAPPRCPTGLYGRHIRNLRQIESHRSCLWGSSGMVYWRHTDLHLLATVDEVVQASRQYAAVRAAGEHQPAVWGTHER
ncbi:MAG: hypothetical protein KatS3mg051_1156 [Anaerolineae bacterium]|nr:MAG: hypothetical protein KatS3mg051_1156 [Anaerolineae bacterium]